MNSEDILALADAYLGPAALCMPSTAGLQRKVYKEMMPWMLCGGQHIRLLHDICAPGSQTHLFFSFGISLCGLCGEL